MIFDCDNFYVTEQLLATHSLCDVLIYAVMTTSMVCASVGPDSECNVPTVYAATVRVAEHVHTPTLRSAGAEENLGVANV